LSEVGDISDHTKRNVSYKMAEGHSLSAVWKRRWPSGQCSCQLHVKVLQLKEGGSTGTRCCIPEQRRDDVLTSRSLHLAKLLL